MKHGRFVALVVMICVVVIGIAIFEGERLYRDSVRSRDATAAQAQGAQSGGASTYR